MHTFRKDQQKQVRSLFSTPLISVQGLRGPEPIPAAQAARREPTLDRTPFQQRTPHTATLTQAGTMQTPPEYPEKTVARGGNVQSHRTEAPWESIFFPH